MPDSDFAYRMDEAMAIVSQLYNEACNLGVQEVEDEMENAVAALGDARRAFERAAL